MAKLIVTEGLDASGKSSQVKLIQKYYEEQGLKCKFIHFPMYGHNKYSDMVSAFLRGEYGDNDKVSPWFVANIYAMDRAMYLKELQVDMVTHDVIIMDRYVLSNVAFQCAKVSGKEKETLKNWILDFEFNFVALPKADLTIFFDVPVFEIEKRLNVERVGEDREYLDGGKDIHEQDIKFQSDVREVYLDLGGIVDNYHLVNTINEKTNELYNIEDLFNSYKKLL